MKSKKFRFVFNDRIFEDGWAEPYMVEVITIRPIDKDDFVKNIDKAIKEVENSKEGISCSEEGIKQIFTYIKDLIKEIKIYQYDYNFEFGK